jgi:hypothetical protein
MMAASPPLHVLHAVAVEAVALEAGRPGIAPPAPGEGVDVGVAVQHQAGPAAGAGQRGDGLEAPGLDLLQVDGVAALAEEAVEEAGDRGLLGLEGRDADERAGQVDQLPPIDAGQHCSGWVIHRRHARRP